jgi:hypothetical protein
VREIKATCDAAGLLEKDYLYVLSAKLIEKYDELIAVVKVQTETLEGAKGTLEKAKDVLVSEHPTRRKVVQVVNYPNADKFVVLCDDGTMWMHGGDMGWGCINASTIS